MITNKEIMPIIRDWILSYPYETPYRDISIEFGEIGIPAAIGDRNALRLNGRTKINERKWLAGGGITTWRINFAIIAWRNTNDPEIWRDILEFINRFIAWVDEEEHKRDTPEQNPLLPQLSDPGTYLEKISANDGSPYEILTSG
ncbi:MAG: hypothetical protein FWH10_08530 [Oscillospiraceae bacterium]|nr:hypothetical protein [Oscillospiraceae bacterium]